MALTGTVTRIFPDANHVGYHLEVKDGVDVVIDKDYMEQFAVGSDVPVKTLTTIGNRMQVDIDAWKALKAVYDHQVYINGAGQIEAGLNV